MMIFSNKTPLVVHSRVKHGLASVALQTQGVEYVATLSARHPKNVVHLDILQTDATNVLRYSCHACKPPRGTPFIFLKLS